MKAKEIIGNCPRDQVEDHISRGIEIAISISDHDLDNQQQAGANCPKKKKQILVGSSEDQDTDTDHTPSQIIPTSTSPDFTDHP